MNRSPDYPSLRIFLDGMLCMMLVYTLISYVWHRKRLHFFYSAYIISLLSYFYLNDLCHLYIDTHAPADLTNRALLAESVVQCLSFIIYGRFAIMLMDLRTNDRVSVRLINAIAALALLLIVFDSIKFLAGTTDGHSSGHSTSQAGILSAFVHWRPFPAFSGCEIRWYRFSLPAPCSTFRGRY